KPIHFKAKEKRAYRLIGSNCPMGAVQEEKFQPVTINYEQGDFFVLYSDGLTEAISPKKERYGYERILELVETYHDAKTEDLLQIIKNSVMSFAEQEILDDDLTLILIKVMSVHSLPKSTISFAKFGSDLSQLKALREFIERLCRQAPGASTSLSTQLQ